MKPKEKAQEIYDKLVVHIQRYDEYIDDRSKYNTIKCALIAVDEILSVIWINLDDEVEYWAEVKKEIEKL